MECADERRFKEVFASVSSVKDGDVLEASVPQDKTLTGQFQAMDRKVVFGLGKEGLEEDQVRRKLFALKDSGCECISDAVYLT